MFKEKIILSEEVLTDSKGVVDWFHFLLQEPKKSLKNSKDFKPIFKAQAYLSYAIDSKTGEGKIKYDFHGLELIKN
ncbi:hypothetical protein AAA799E16_01754 [Marine Group I thaumarchaeote SCGC AAA799-E16]|uniref:Uncharacterized protein n=2 Tax=Marine Group I TaxID=905826 RepID=A0A087RXJ4_9ARCH|nr:hypothetical protein AAA799E16_01754 [Marine Group I thaumarchaeote SCGC AAA799-E16]KFM18198.1 hypothetical protein SCCGRSA3_01268 [Marine Group I thaumarchaeote SCGC RSA3]